MNQKGKSILNQEQKASVELETSNAARSFLYLLFKVNEFLNAISMQVVYFAYNYYYVILEADYIKNLNCGQFILMFEILMRTHRFLHFPYFLLFR